MKPLVLIIDNDLAFRETLSADLSRAGFYAYIASAGTAARHMAVRLKPDALLLSADLDDGSAYLLASQMRQDASTATLPIIMYSAFTQLADKARCLDAGADDFIGRPFTAAELVAHIGGLMRHGGESGEIIEVGDLRVDLPGFSVTYEGRPVDLSRTLFSILCLLARQPGRVFTREQIRDAVWGERANISDRAVDVCMNRLRLNLGGEARGAIKTVRGIGYKFSPNPTARSSLPPARKLHRGNDQGFLMALADGLAPAC